MENKKGDVNASPFQYLSMQKLFIRQQLQRQVRLLRQPELQPQL